MVGTVVLDWREVYDWAGLRVSSMVRAEYPPATTEILDVGAGQGKYRRLLQEYPHVDACELWQPYVDEYELTKLYRSVYACNVVNLVRSDVYSWASVPYDVTIFGDVLEHLTPAHAQFVLRSVYARCHDVIVVVPYLYEQGPEHGNVYQRHLQDDLTPELMTRRYPELRLIAVETRDDRPFKGLYRRRSR